MKGIVWDKGTGYWCCRPKDFQGNTQRKKVYLVKPRNKSCREGQKEATRLFKELNRTIAQGIAPDDAWRIVKTGESVPYQTPLPTAKNLYVNPDVKSGNTKKKKWNKNLVSAVRNRFIADMADRAAFGSVSAQRPMDLKYNTKMFVDLYGDKHMKDITNEVLRDFRKRLYKLMAQGKYRKHTIANFTSAVKQLINWSFREGVINTTPRMMGDILQVKFDSTDRKQNNWHYQVNKGRGEINELRKLYDSVGNRSDVAGWNDRPQALHINRVLRLSLLLAINCGYTQKDISTLQVKHVHWIGTRTPRIKRPRHKTGEPMNHAMFAETREQIKPWLVGKEPNDLVMTQFDGRTPLLHHTHASKRRVCLIGSWMRSHIRRTFGDEEPRRISDIRKTVGQFFIDRHTGLEKFMLGHSQTTNITMRYVKLPQSQMDKAIFLWEMASGFLMDGKHKSRYKGEKK